MNDRAEVLSDADYAALLRFRTGLRRFLHWSAEVARAAGLTPSQHQLLLAIRGWPGEQPPTIGDVADQLLLRHHSVVELVDRAAAVGLVDRVKDAADHRLVRLELTAQGERTLAGLSGQHREELDRLRPQLTHIWQGLDDPTDATPGATST